MSKICTIVGARPQFIKLAPLSRALRESFKEVLIHTGQHYDAGMSDVFFTELDIPAPDYHLGIGGGLHGEQTGSMLIEIEKVLLKETPDWVVVIGDTNSTLAGGLAAAKLNIPVAHVEAGLRSFNRRMPEEQNRVVVDHLSRLLFATSDVAVVNLKREGIVSGVFDVGDIMLDSILLAQSKAESRSALFEKLALADQPYYFCTLHRAENTDVKEVLQNILQGISQIRLPVICPLHPRTKKKISEFGLRVPANMKLIDPLGYLDSVALMMRAKAILTDSGGIQKEAYYLSVPCITLREETEWIETVQVGWNMLAGSSSERLATAIDWAAKVRAKPRPDLYGHGQTAKKIADVLIKSVS